MSGWDAPTGSWDSRPEPDESGGPDEQGYQQGEPTGGHRAVRGGEGRLRAGRRGLPGYEQAQNYDQTAGDLRPGYDQGPGYGQPPGYGQQGYGPGSTGPQPSFGSGSGSGAGQMVRYGQRPADDRAYGSGPQDALGPSRAMGSGPLSAPPAQGPQATPSPLDAPGTFGSVPSGPQRPLGPGPQDPLSSGPQSTFSSGSRRAIGSAPQSPPVPPAALGSGSRGAVGYGEEATAVYRQYGADDPTRSGWSDASDQQGYGDRQGYGNQPGYGDRQGYGDQPGYGSSPGYGTRAGSGPQGSGGEPGYGPPSQPGQDYGQNSFAPNIPNTPNVPNTPNTPNTPNAPAGQPGSDRGYGTQPGYGPPGYGQSGYSQQASGPGGFPPGGYGGQADQSRMSQDYQTEVYPQPGSEPSDYPQDGFSQDPGVTQAYGTQPGYGQNGFGQDPGVTQAYGTQPGYGQNGFDPSIPSSPGIPTTPGVPNGQATYPADGYGQGGFSAPGSRQEGYPQDPYAQDPYTQDPYTQDTYTQDPYGQAGYGQPGFEQPPGPGYDDDDVASRGRAPRSRSGPPRSGPGAPQHLDGARMALYLAAAVVGVVLIVIVVVQLTKSGGNKAATGSSTPSTGTTAATGSNGTNGYVFTQTAEVGTSFPLNKTATKAFTPNLVHQSALIAGQIKARGYGKPGKVTVGVYDLTPVTSISSSSFKGIAFVGYDGTFNPKSVINLVRSTLVSPRVVSPGPHGGDMICGYDTSSGAQASECVWVTKTTFGQVHFLEGETAVKYSGASKLALEVRNAVEVKAA